VLDILLLNRRGSLELIPHPDPLLLGRLGSVRKASEPSSHTSLALGRLIVPIPIFHRWKGGCATTATVGYLHVASSETTLEVLEILLIDEAVFSRMP
jgi:hypothetical protein